MNRRHTTAQRLPSPAPWRLDYVPGRFVSGVELPRCVIRDGNGVTLFLSNHDLPGDLQLANTRLACLAPRLLASLDRLVRQIEIDFPPEEVGTRLSAALAAAGTTLDAAAGGERD